jgi:hypothetical protein
MAWGDEARKNAEIFGKEVKSGNLGAAFDALRGKPRPAPEKPRPDDRDDGGDINITINR